jgi:Na+-driven multidrug efflux pump
MCVYILPYIFVSGISSLFISIISCVQRPGAVAVSFFIGAWIVSVPLSYVFGFPLGLDLIGLWYGLTCGYTMVTLISLVFIYKSDWPALAVLAFKRAEKDSADVIGVGDEEEGVGEVVGRMSTIN